MSIKIGNIDIKEEFDWSNDILSFFKFKQNKVSYYCISFQVLDERYEGYIASSLSSKLDKLFKESDYNAKMLNELIADEITEFYFLSFADENPDSEQIEYVGEMLKKDVLSFFKIAE
jgi:hypothetical protein